RCCVARRSLPSSPTRRSSDLRGRAAGVNEARIGRCAMKSHDSLGELLASIQAGLYAQQLRAREDAARLPPQPFVTISRQAGAGRSEEHTSELQSQSNLVCRLL